MKKEAQPYCIKSVQEEHQFLGLSKPKHPLISVFPMQFIETFDNLPAHFTLGFYCIAIKKNFEGKLKYGQRYYDYDAGVMSFISPGQVMAHIKGEDSPKEGINLLFHPDFLSGYTLANTIRNYGFFSYEINEALHLSEQEEATVENIIKNIEAEYQSNIDRFSQDLMIAQIELLLQYSNRFYNRQFITRKPANDDILVRLENLLTDCFSNENLSVQSPPTVRYISEQLHVSPNYLSDMLRSMTGQTTQQHIHERLIDKAKELLTTTGLSVREIAYRLGFEYPQSLNKLFKKKTNISPLEFRASFN